MKALEKPSGHPLSLNSPLHLASLLLFLFVNFTLFIYMYIIHLLLRDSSVGQQNSILAVLAIND